MGDAGAMVMAENLEFVPNLEILNIGIIVYIYIYIAGNNITESGAQALAGYLNYIPKLKRYYLGTQTTIFIDNNNIGDNGAKILAQNLKFNPNLTEIKLSTEFLNFKCR